MKITVLYSHLNGHEWLLIHERKVWREVATVIASVDAERYKTKVSKEKTMAGEMLSAPTEINKAFSEKFREAGWKESRTDSDPSPRHDEPPSGPVTMVEFPVRRFGAHH